jgi:lysophospholipase L1-like esterase
MQRGLSKFILPVISLVGAIAICPLSSFIVGIDVSPATEALKIYYWFGCVFLLILGASSIKWKSTRFRNILKSITMLLIITASVEFACAIAFKAHYGQWSHNFHMNLNRFIFEPHPYLIGSLIKSAEYEREGLKYSHNSAGFRGEEFPMRKYSSITRIATLGGSTTYGVGVNDNETWPFLLEQILGEEFEVFNLGVPGYTTAENLIQTGLQLSDYEPDIAIYLVGLNDMRNFNLGNLQADYTDFHAPSLHSALGLCPTENIPSLATLKMMLILFQKSRLIAGCPNQNMRLTRNAHTGNDERALGLYRRNLESISSICRSQGIEVLFVPQILLEEVLNTGDYSWWIPFVPTSEIDDMMLLYNQELKQVAENTNYFFADSVISYEWSKKDFVDMSHFNRAANQQFAEILAKYIVEINSKPSDTSLLDN